MRVGGERVTLALASAPKMTIYGLMSALPALIKQQVERSALVSYMTTGMRMLTENTAHLVNGGKYLSVSYNDMINPPPEETRTADEIIDHMKKKLAKAGEK